MNKTILKKIEILERVQARDKPDAGSFLGRIIYADGRTLEIYENKKCMIEILSIVADIMSGSDRNYTKCEISRKGLKNGQMDIAWQLINERSLADIKQDEIIES